jgi:hypothetical protein
MADEDHILRNAVGTVVGVTCTKCNRALDGDKPRRCDDCADSRSSSSASRAASSEESSS